MLSPKKDILHEPKRRVNPPNPYVSEVPDLSKFLVHQVQIVLDQAIIIIPRQQSARVLVENEGEYDISVLPKAQTRARRDVFDAEPSRVTCIHPDQVPAVVSKDKVVFKLYPKLT